MTHTITCPALLPESTHFERDVLQLLASPDAEHCWPPLVRRMKAVRSAHHHATAMIKTAQYVDTVSEYLYFSLAMADFCFNQQFITKWKQLRACPNSASPANSRRLPSECVFLRPPDTPLDLFDVTILKRESNVGNRTLRHSCETRRDEGRRRRRPERRFARTPSRTPQK